MELRLDSRFFRAMQRLGYDATASDGDLKYRTCRNQTSFLSQINPKATNKKQSCQFLS